MVVLEWMGDTVLISVFLLIGWTIFSWVCGVICNEMVRFIYHQWDEYRKASYGVVPSDADVRGYSYRVLDRDPPVEEEEVPFPERDAPDPVLDRLVELYGPRTRPVDDPERD